MAKTVARNRKARHDYDIEETLEAGIVLTGTEVKSARQGQINLKDGYAVIENGEAFIYNMHISPYEHGNRFNHEPKRPRKLLLHRREIDYLYGKTRERGYTLIPLKAYFRRGLLKLELGLGKGRKKHDKREAIAKKEAERRMQQAVRRRR